MLPLFSFKILKEPVRIFLEEKNILEKSFLIEDVSNNFAFESDFEEYLGLCLRSGVNNISGII